MLMQSLAQDHMNRPLTPATMIRGKFNIFRGKGNSKQRCSEESTLLPIQYLVYETLVNGISSAVHGNDFKGVMGTNYEVNGEEYHIVFAMWYSQSNHIYFLSSLGQYSSRVFDQRMQQFKRTNAYRLKIKLAPIHAEGLTHLEEKLSRSNLSGANVCLIEDTLETER